VGYDNIELRTLQLDQAISLPGGIEVVAYRVPHREEFSEVVGFEIRGPERSALFIPDIDGWQDWDAWGVVFEDRLAAVDFAFVDGTFWADGEIEGRDMSGFPHPRISQSLQRFSTLPESERGKIHFIHLNHTNPAHDPDSPESQAVSAAGCNLARRLDLHPL
jgi:pyrroloquinoline quinone biosynthesis protein B